MVPMMPTMMVPVVPMMMMPMTMVPMTMVPMVMPPVVMMTPADLFGLQAIDLVLSYDGGLGAIRARRQQGLFR